MLRHFIIHIFQVQNLITNVGGSFYERKKNNLHCTQQLFEFAK